MSDVDPRLVRALRAQLARRPPGASRVGWKVGAGEREQIGDEPIVVGHLASVLADGSTYAGGGGDLRADAELAVGDEQFGVALEIVDLAGDDDPVAIVERNVFHRAVAFGPMVGALPNELRARIVVDEEERGSATAPDDVVARVDAVQRVLAAVGERVVPGDRIITGSIVQVPVAAGETVTAEIDGLGSVTVAVA